MGFGTTKRLFLCYNVIELLCKRRVIVQLNMCGTQFLTEHLRKLLIEG